MNCICEQDIAAMAEKQILICYEGANLEGQKEIQQETFWSWHGGC